MRVETDDEIYRVDAVWLGPEQATLPARVRYVAWGTGFLTWLVVFTVMRQLAGIDLGFFAVGWSLVITVVITRWLTARVTHERTLLGVLALAAGEITAPASPPPAQGSSTTSAGVRTRRDLPAPRTPRGRARGDRR